MQRKRICLPPLSVNYYPWLVACNDDSGDQIFYNIHDVLSCYRCRIPELVGRRIQACFHGWVILSNHQQTHWFLWDANSTSIHLPPLKDVASDRPFECYLSSPPRVPGSVLLLARKGRPNFVFCRLDREEKSLRWIEMSYVEQLRSIIGRHDILARLTCCNGEVYAVAPNGHCVVKVHIVVEEKSVTINLLPFVNLPEPPNPSRRSLYTFIFLTGSSLELLVMFVGIVDVEKLTPAHVYLCKLDITSMVWVEKEDLKDTVLYVDMVGNRCSRAVVSEFGGYVHILYQRGKVVYSYNVKDKTISKSFMRCLDFIPSHVAVWPMPDPEFRLQSNGKCRAKEDEMVVRSTAKEVVQEEEIEANVFNLPVDVLKMILEFCVGVEYLNLRATCKLCHLAAPLINNRKVPQTYSVVSSPWLMVFDIRGGTITFTDPMFGDNYFIRAPKIVSNSIITCSRYGWLLLLIGDSRLAFFNPFTGETRELPPRRTYSEIFCFSAPPTSLDCMVVGFSGPVVFFHFVAGEPIWHPLDLDSGDATLTSLELPTFCGRDVYALRNKAEVDVFRQVGHDYVWEAVVDWLPKPSCSWVDYFLTTCDQHLVLLMVGDFGEAVEVFKLTEELEWEKMDGLGRHAIYVCDALSTCVCMAAKTPEMENKIFFSRFRSNNGKVMFYCMETRRFHTFDGRRNIVQETSLEDSYHHIYNLAWIEPTWC